MGIMVDYLGERGYKEIKKRSLLSAHMVGESGPLYVEYEDRKEGPYNAVSFAVVAGILRNRAKYVLNEKKLMGN